MKIMMSSHLLSICIFCFICATNTPCASHASLEQEDINNLKINSPINSDLNPNELLSHKTILSNNNNLNLNNLSENKDTDLIGNNIINGNKQNILKHIFNKYGNGETITMIGFEKLLNHLYGLQALAIKHEIQDETIEELSKSVTCSSRNQLSTLIEAELNTTKQLTEMTMESICPILLSAILSSKDCHEISYDFQLVPNTNNNDIHNPKLREWLYSIGAVIVISACGVFSLIIIPVMQKKFYKPLLQFLVALAVGTLAGDALLHLLPHSMMVHINNEEYNGHHHNNSVQGHHDHDNMWKGFVAMLGLTFFFIIERFIPFASKWWRNRQKNKAHSHVKVLNRGQDIVSANNTQCRDKYNTYSRCYRDIVDDPSTTFLETDDNNTVNKHKLRKLAESDPVLWNVHDDCPIRDGNKRPDLTTKKQTNQNNDHLNDMNAFPNCTEMNIMLPAAEENHIGDGSITVILSEHGSNHHGHSHKHGHVHAPPQNYSSVAWMVIMGDGLHNFTDGMAIGAAFSSSLAGGFSTAVAVFCHELPHELGDFAMLLKAGMSINQALCYNLLSSILCLMGNLFGMWLGNTEYASSWVFAVAAGTFLYIALVDMIPELSSAHEDEGNLMQCFLHLSGLILGFGIMTLIALYEHDLKNIFNDK